MKKLLLLFLFLPVATYSEKTVGLIDFESQYKSDAQKVYEAIVKYSYEYDVPINIAFNIANKESNYRGPNDFLYTANVGKSYLGPMQLSFKYCAKYADSTVTRQTLKSDIYANVSLALKVLRKHYNRYKSWTKACAVYNTGNPRKVNKYVKKVLVKNYTKNWN